MTGTHLLKYDGHASSERCSIVYASSEIRNMTENFTSHLNFYQAADLPICLFYPYSIFKG